MIFTAQNIDKAFFCHCGVFRAGDTSYHILYKYPENDSATAATNYIEAEEEGNDIPVASQIS